VTGHGEIAAGLTSGTIFGQNDAESLHGRFRILFYPANGSPETANTRNATKSFVERNHLASTGREGNLCD
jgi:hypothetical protein